MQVLYARCAGLDVHKDAVVASARITVEGQPSNEVASFDTTTAGLVELSEWLTERGLHARRLGGDRGLWEARLAYFGLSRLLKKSAEKALMFVCIA